jgi:DNA-binding transcriptional LysR family regulator
MELRQLRYFHAVATLGGFRRAAESLRIAQPAVSQQIQRLEAELGAKLFDRDLRPVGLTAVGERLLTHAERVLTDVAAIEADMHQFSAQGRPLAVGLMQYLTLLDLPDVLVRFRRGNPSITVTVNVGNTGELEDGLRSGELDVAIAHAHAGHAAEGLIAHPLRTEELVVVVGQAHPLAGHAAVDIAELADAAWVVSRPGGLIRETFQRAAQQHGFTPQVSFETADLATTMTLVARNLGVAVVPRSVGTLGHADVTVVPIRADAPTLTVAVLRNANRKPTAEQRAFVAFTEAAVRPL